MEFHELLQRLCQELQIAMPKQTSEKTWVLAINPELVVIFFALNPGCSMQAVLTECPQKKLEELFVYLMRANFLGQGTGGARIGMDADEKLLTLSLGFSYELNYQTLKETVEDFVNYVVYWREEIIKFGEK